MHGASVVAARALVLYDLVVNLSHRYAVVAGKVHAGKAGKISKVQVGLGAVLGYVNFAVLVGADVARVNVYVRVAFYHRHF